MKFRFVKFFDRHSILYAHQYGFRKQHSVIHALLDVISLSYDAIQSKQYTALLLMDFRKAFDTASHDILMHKLYHYGIRGPAFDLIASYLSSRYQFVSVNNSNSNLRPVNIGVPQGSTQGPLLFLVYVNDLSNLTATSPRLFADDTCLVLSSPLTPSLTQTCINELCNLKSWCDANYLQINPAKSVSLIIPFKQSEPIHEMQLFYNESVMANKDVCKYLGVSIDSKLNFKAFINHVQSKIAKSVSVLSRLHYLFPSSTLLSYISVYFNPFSYTDFCFGEALFPPTSQICNASKTKLYKLYLILL